MKIALRIFLFTLFTAFLISSHSIAQKSQAAEASLCNTFYGGGETSSINDSCKSVSNNTPTPSIAQTQPQSQPQSKPTPTQLNMVKEVPVLKQTPPTGPEDLGIVILTASGMMGYLLRKKA